MATPLWQTDGQTDARPFHKDSAPRAMRAVSITWQYIYLNPCAAGRDVRQRWLRTENEFLRRALAMETPHVPQSLVGRHHREHRQRRLNPRLLQSLQLPAQRMGNEVVQEDRQKQNRTRKTMLLWQPAPTMSKCLISTNANEIHWLIYR